MASVIPGFHGQYDIDDLVACIAPRKLLIVSAEDDKYSKDAPYIVEKGKKAYEKYAVPGNLYHKRYEGEHALTKERHDDIVAWIMEMGQLLV